MPEVLGAPQVKTAIISAQDTYAGPILLHGWFDASIAGVTGTGSTVRIRRSFDNGLNWKIVASYTTDQEDTGFAPRAALYEIGVPAGDYVGGSITVIIGQ